MIDLCDFEENTLFIIGNGFDAAHGIKSSYWDFHNWLYIHRYSDPQLRHLSTIRRSQKDYSIAHQGVVHGTRWLF